MKAEIEISGHDRRPFSPRPTGSRTDAGAGGGSFRHFTATLPGHRDGCGGGAHHDLDQHCSDAWAEMMLVPQAMVRHRGASCARRAEDDQPAF